MITGEWAFQALCLMTLSLWDMLRIETHRLNHLMDRRVTLDVLEETVTCVVGDVEGLNVRMDRVERALRGMRRELRSHSGGGGDGPSRSRGRRSRRGVHSLSP